MGRDYRSHSKGSRQACCIADLLLSGRAIHPEISLHQCNGVIHNQNAKGSAEELLGVVAPKKSFQESKTRGSKVAEIGLKSLFGNAESGQRDIVDFTLESGDRIKEYAPETRKSLFVKT